MYLHDARDRTNNAFPGHALTRLYQCTGKFNGLARTGDIVTVRLVVQSAGEYLTAQ